ncbi:hypothetical protein ABZ912_42485 [Nonomuraea angiospora]|uniref:hypothetical protein n=1 Tax=Nonomuraea angiospora TaxID=46172 RepID=UPI0033EBD322
MNRSYEIDLDSLDARGNVNIVLPAGDRPTGPRPTCPPFCTQHFADAENGPGFCYSDAPDGVGLSYDQNAGAVVFIHELPDGGDMLTPADARRFAAALLAQAARAEQAAATFTFPATR